MPTAQQRQLRRWLITASSTLALGAILGIALALLAPRRAVLLPTAGCRKYPVVQAMWVCHGNVYVLRGRQMQWAGPVSALYPMPKPPQTLREK